MRTSSIGDTPSTKAKETIEIGNNILITCPQTATIFTIGNE
jgi:hypothetical protein